MMGENIVNIYQLLNGKFKCMQIGKSNCKIIEIKKCLNVNENSM